MLSLESETGERLKEKSIYFYFSQSCILSFDHECIMFIYFHAKLTFISNTLQSGHTDLFSYFTNFNDITEYWMDFCCLLKKKSSKFASWS